jgi:dolichol-phosphate mannosyltransferase
MITPGSPANPAKRAWRLGVVTPLANEEATIELFLGETLRQLQEGDRIYCVIDNKSTDRTLEIARELARKDARIVPVWAPENRCAVDAYFRGYREALAGGADYILEMDGGMSHRPGEIPLFIEAADRGVDFVAGSRFIKGGAHRGSLSRWFISRGGTILANLLLGTKMRDMCSGFECFSRPAMQAVLDHGVKSRAHFFQTEIRYLMHSYNWVEVPIIYTNPSKSVGSSNIKEAIRNLLLLRKESQQSRVTP